MKNSLFVLISLSVLALFAFKSGPGDILEIGAKAPEANTPMKDVSGKEMTLSDLSKANGLLVVFSCNTCPFVVGNPGKNSAGWEGRYNELNRHAESNKVGMVLINSNEAYRDGADSFEAMQKHAKENNYSMPYLVDKNHVLADAFGALTTPHIFLFDKDMQLVYKGAIDDNVNNASEVEAHWLRDAIRNLAAGNKIDPESTRQLGCSIKRVKS